MLRRLAAIAPRARLVRALLSTSDEGPAPLRSYTGMRPARTRRASKFGQIYGTDLTSPSRDQNYDQPLWKLHRSSWRHVRHMGEVPFSGVLWRVAWPNLALLGANGACLTYYNTAVAPAAPLCCPAEPFTMTTLALGLLVTFRTNASYERYAEARALWDEVCCASRDLARLALLWLPADDGRGGAPRRDTLRLVKAFAIALKFHLTDDGNYYEFDSDWAPDAKRIRVAMKAELEEKAELSDDEVGRLCAAANRPLWALQQIGSVVHRALDTTNPVDTRVQMELEDHVQRLMVALGHCERIVRTPIPTSYTRHTSRFLVIWLHALPFVLWPSTDVATVPATLFVAWALLGIEDIGVRLEEPFDVLPLWQYAKLIERSIAQLEDGARAGGLDIGQVP